VWLLAGVLAGGIAYGNSGAIAGALILGALGVGAALFSYYFGSATVLAAVGAQEADPHEYQQLHNIVQTLAIGDGLPLPKVYVMDDPSPNAFATGRDPNHAAVTVTTGLLQMMNREERRISFQESRRSGGDRCIRDRHHLHGDCVSGRTSDAARAIAAARVAG
jgi:heat shock protein HtpX